MKVTFLGTGPAWGHPELSCNCPAYQPATSWHMSFQRGIDFIQGWQPDKLILVHMSHEDFTRKLKSPLLPSAPKNHDEWQQAVQQFLRGFDIEVAYDGMSIVV